MNVLISIPQHRMYQNSKKPLDKKLKKHFEDKGDNVTVSHSFFETLAHIQETNFDRIIIDEWQDFNKDTRQNPTINRCLWETELEHLNSVHPQLCDMLKENLLTMESFALDCLLRYKEKISFIMHLYQASLWEAEMILDKNKGCYLAALFHQHIYGAPEDELKAIKIIILQRLKNENYIIPVRLKNSTVSKEFTE